MLPSKLVYDFLSNGYSQSCNPSERVSLLLIIRSGQCLTCCCSTGLSRDRGGSKGGLLALAGTREYKQSDRNR